jgi:hypothetical protein
MTNKEFTVLYEPRRATHLTDPTEQTSLPKVLGFPGSATSPPSTATGATTSALRTDTTWIGHHLEPKRNGGHAAVCRAFLVPRVRALAGQHCRVGENKGSDSIRIYRARSDRARN